MQGGNNGNWIEKAVEKDLEDLERKEHTGHPTEQRLESSDLGKTVQKGLKLLHGTPRNMAQLEAQNVVNDLE